MTGSWLANRCTSRKVDRIDAQVSNDHTSNLRDDLTEAVAQSAKTAEVAAENASAIASLQRSIAGVEGFARDISGSVRAIQHSMDRREKIRDQEIAERAAHTDAMITGLQGQLDRHITSAEEYWARQE